MLFGEYREIYVYSKTNTNTDAVPQMSLIGARE